MKRALVACEESQVSTIALLNLGFDAWSCDLQPCSGTRPDRHITGDVTDILYEPWDLIIAHPPCTYLTNASACRMFPLPGILDCDRYYKAMEAKRFFMMFYNHPCKYMIIENPKPLTVVGLPPYDQILNPYDFGAGYSKMTCFWYHGFPGFLPTCIPLSYERDVITKRMSTAKERSKSDFFMYNEICKQAATYF